MTTGNSETSRPRLRISIWYVIGVVLVFIGIVACSLPSSILLSRHRYPASWALFPLPRYQVFRPVEHGVYYEATVPRVTLDDYGAVTRWYQQHGWSCDGACEIFFDYRLGQWRVEGYGVLQPSHKYLDGHLLFLNLSVEQSITLESP